MKEHYLDYEQAVLLKEIGFDIPTISGFSYVDSPNVLTNAPTYQEAFRWFRDKHGIHVAIDYVAPKKDYPSGYVAHLRGVFYPLNIVNFVPVKLNDADTLCVFDTYDKAEIAAITTCINHIRNKK